MPRSLVAIQPRLSLGSGQAPEFDATPVHGIEVFERLELLERRGSIGKESGIVT